MVKLINKIRRNKWFQRAFLAVMVLFVALIIMGPQLPIFRSLNDYLAHFALGFFLLGILFLIFNKRKAILTCFGLCGVLCVFVKNESNSQLKAPELNDQQQISMVHVNLSTTDNGYDLYQSITKLDPDVITVQELTPDWAYVLDKLISDKYPHRFEEVRIDPYGKGMYSKLDITKVDTISLNDQSHNDYCLEVKAGAESFCLFSSYLTPALDVNSRLLAKEQLKHLETKVSAQKHRSLVFGEYNMTYWNDDIRRFRDHTKLLNTRKDVLPTSLQVPYDHIFYTPDIECTKFHAIKSDAGINVGLFGSFQVKRDPNSEPKSSFLQ